MSLSKRSNIHSLYGAASSPSYAIIIRAPRASHFRSSASFILTFRSATSTGSWSAFGSAAVSSGKYTEPSSAEVRGQNKCCSSERVLSSLRRLHGKLGGDGHHQHKDHLLDTLYHIRHRVSWVPLVAPLMRIFLWRLPAASGYCLCQTTGS